MTTIDDDDNKELNELHLNDEELEELEESLNEEDFELIRSLSN